tara:strand:+ start:294 stop:566 length:273 start_codon:yes stop_codon:yes gene_type:complete
MFNPLNLISKIIKSGNQRELDKIKKIVDKINKLETNFQNLNENEFPLKTEKFINEVKNGKDLNEILPEAFALVREASKRINNERHFDFHL